MKIDKSWYKKPKDRNFLTSISAGGVVIRDDGGCLFIALLRNDRYKEYVLPKGRCEAGESLEETARREIQEETGLVKLSLKNKLGVRERLSLVKNAWKITHYFLFSTEDIMGKQNLQPDEGKLELEWFDLDKLPQIFWPEQKEIIEENREKIKFLLQNKN